MRTIEVVLYREGASGYLNVDVSSFGDTREEARSAEALELTLRTLDAEVIEVADVVVESVSLGTV